MIPPATAAALALLAPAASEGPRQVPGWELSCKAGDDEYASNCTATSRRGPVVIELATGDSQVFLIVRAPACRDAYPTEQASWQRTDLTSQSRDERRVTLRLTTRVLIDALRSRCPELKDVNAELAPFPDIAVFGDP